MLKKAGIVVAAAAAGLLALSPLAFAGDKGHDAHGGTTDPQTADCSYTAANEGTVDNNIGAEGELLGLVGGALSPVTQAGAPVNAQAGAPVGSCNNIEDVVDVNVEDNFQDNSTTETESVENIEESFNTED